MTLRRIFTILTPILLLTLAVGLANAKPGGGGGGGGGKGPGGGGGKGPGGGGFGGMKGWGWNAWQNNFKKPEPEIDPKKLQEEIDNKVKKFVVDGFAALHAGDTAAAYEAFSDALDLAPNSADGHLGMGLTRAAKGSFAPAQTELEAALRYKADPRVTQYNMAVSYTRVRNFGRAAVLLNKLLGEIKPTDELILNAQLTLLSTMDDKQRKLIAVFPDLMKSLSNTNLAYASAKHPGMLRWGLSWVSPEEFKKLRAAGEKESFPDRLPFILPDNFPLPEKGEWSAVNVLLPDQPVETVAIAPQPPIEPKPADPRPADPPKSNSPFKLGGGGGDTTPTQPTPPTPPTPSIPDKPVVAKVDPTPRPTGHAPILRTIRGSAFAVAPDLLVTAGRLVVNAKEIQLQDELGRRVDAVLVLNDPETGIALLRAAGKTFKPMGLADAAKPGPVGIAAFVKPTVFNPDLDIVRATLVNAADKWSLRCVSHPRSAGSPFFDEQGRVMGLLTAARDDAPDHLPVITVEALRKFSQGRFTPATASSGQPEETVLEMTVTRQD